MNQYNLHFSSTLILKWPLQASDWRMFVSKKESLWWSNTPADVSGFIFGTNKITEANEGMIDLECLFCMPNLLDEQRPLENS